MLHSLTSPTLEGGGEGGWRRTNEWCLHKRHSTQCECSVMYRVWDQIQLLDRQTWIGEDRLCLLLDKSGRWSPHNRCLASLGTTVVSHLCPLLFGKHFGKDYLVRHSFWNFAPHIDIKKHWIRSEELAPTVETIAPIDQGRLIDRDIKISWSDLWLFNLKASFSRVLLCLSFQSFEPIELRESLSTEWQSCTTNERERRQLFH